MHISDADDYLEDQSYEYNTLHNFSRKMVSINAILIAK